MARRAPTREQQAPRFEVFLNGKRLAVAGIRGEGNLNAHVHWSRTTHYGEGPWTTGRMRLSVAGGDFNDPVWDRFKQWVDRPLAVGDRVQIRVTDIATPTPARSTSRMRRIPIDEWPSRRNPTAVSVRGAEVCAVTSAVLLRVGTRLQGLAQLTPAQAKKIGRGLVSAAEAIEERRKRRRSGRTR